MPQLQLSFAILISRLIRKYILFRKLGGGSAAPGLYALKVDPNLISKLCRNFKKGVILISGTNGKTTTSRMVSTILETAGFKTIHNRTGSNLTRGIASVLLENASLSGKFEADFAIFETDEAVLPNAIKQTGPKFVLLTNLFRDQLDRFGEVDKIKRIWQDALLELDRESTVILNADDPAIAHLGHRLISKVFYFGLEDPQVGEKELFKFADTKYCGFCANPLDWEIVYISHLGKFKCPNCKNKRPEPQISATGINLLGIGGSNFKLSIYDKKQRINLKLPGLYNVYNGLAAAALANSINIDTNTTKAGLEKFKAVFGRVEQLFVNNKSIWMFLIKNPTGFNEVIRTIFESGKNNNLLIAINDKIADGKDVSWLWDVDFEKLKGSFNNLFVSGIRALDMALRLKYANVKNPNLVSENFIQTFEEAVKSTKEGEILFVLPTYTAMLEIRDYLTKKGIVQHFSKD
ncbi:MAG TPA: MurT ligase domain-containing protein [Patescibacteria group bacterium]